MRCHRWTEHLENSNMANFTGYIYSDSDDKAPSGNFTFLYGDEQFLVSSPSVPPPPRLSLEGQWISRPCDTIQLRYQLYLF